jgi:hypothetical protein
MKPIRAVTQHERRDTPVVEDFRDLRAFAAVHQHDIAAARRDDDGAAIRRTRARSEYREKGHIERAIALRAGNRAGWPQGDIVIGRRGRGLFGARDRRHDGQDKQQTKMFHDAPFNDRMIMEETPLELHRWSPTTNRHVCNAGSSSSAPLRWFCQAPA